MPHSAGCRQDVRLAPKLTFFFFCQLGRKRGYGILLHAFKSIDFGAETHGIWHSNLLTLAPKPIDFAGQPPCTCHFWYVAAAVHGRANSAFPIRKVRLSAGSAGLCETKLTV